MVPMPGIFSHIAAPMTASRWNQAQGIRIPQLHLLIGKGYAVLSGKNGLEFITDMVMVTGNADPVNTVGPDIELQTLQFYRAAKIG